MNSTTDNLAKSLVWPFLQVAKASYKYFDHYNGCDKEFKNEDEEDSCVVLLWFEYLIE